MQHHELCGLCQGEGNGELLESTGACELNLVVAQTRRPYFPCVCLCVWRERESARARARAKETKEKVPDALGGA